MEDATESGPLSGLTVVDFSGMISGGFATMMLADFGAEVIMIEHPEYSDPIREWAPKSEGKSLWWKSLARNKRCVTLDLSMEPGQEIARSLVEDADAVFENFRPGTMERWDLGYESLREVNEAIIMVRLSGYGQSGPYSDKAGFGTVAEGISGWAHINGFPDREPLLPPISLADLTAAQFAVQGLLFAIFERDVGADGGSGEGQVIDVSLYEPLFRLFIGDVEAYDQKGTVPKRTGNRHPSASPRNIYETADGHITLSASSQNIFENVMTAIGREELIHDDRFKTNELRVEHAAELDAVIESWTRQRTTDEALETLEAHGAVVGPIYDISDAFEDEHFSARDNIIEVDDDDLGPIKTFGLVPKFSRTAGSVSHTGPAKGEHNEPVYESLGLSADDRAELEDDGVI